MPKENTDLYGDLTLFPYQVKKPIKETLSWLTDIMEAHNGLEQRYSRRTMPRQNFKYSIPLTYWKKFEASNTLYGALRKDFAIPIWSESQEVGNIIDSQLVINCDTLYRDLRPSSLAFLVNANGVYQLVEIDTITDISITLTEGADLINNAYLLPVRKGFIVGNPYLSTNGNEATATINFQIDDNLALTPQVPTQYKDNDIYFDEPLKKSNFVKRSFVQSQDITDYSLGPIARRTTWINARRSIPYINLLENEIEMREYKDRLYRFAGRFRSFWLPTFEDDLQIKTNGLITTTLTIANDSYIEYASNRVNVAFEDSSGNWHPREITSAIPAGLTNTTLTLNIALNLQRTDIVRTSYLGLNRLNTDKIEINWIGAGVARSNFITMEISPQ